MNQNYLTEGNNTIPNSWYIILRANTERCRREYLRKINNKKIPPDLPGRIFLSVDLEFMHYCYFNASAIALSRISSLPSLIPLAVCST